ncbi:membrane-associated protein, putative [Bodo saltans]|uniref:Membrane-associated protein, putative n=1 Tax=Bodo saltans TaxID=75058 RepID=A0A0S4JFD9_BODSA|nr:membrane-associated protein, putative [Bodo saltans]|eukprot:CUG88692.1 membrane-associated protein, putative [Bodo saltans]
MQIPKIERRPKRPSRNAGGSEMPTSAGGYILRRLRPRLPVSWQYGWKWQAVKGAWLFVGSLFLLKLGYTMFFSLSDSDIDRKAAQYTYVRDERGVVVDIGYKPLLDAGIRARKRTAKYLEADDE